jgi:hypothetical protein
MVMTFWAVMVGTDFRFGGPPAQELYLQAAAIAVIFTGYVSGWWSEVAGAILVVGGTVALFVMCYFVESHLPAEGAWLAAPGLFYAVAHYADKEHASLR